MRLEEISIVVARLLVGFGFLELAQVFFVSVAETVGRLELEELNRFLRQARLFLPQAGEDLKDAIGFPCELRERRSLVPPTWRSIDERLNDGMRTGRNIVAHRFELRSQLLRFDHLARRPLLEQKGAAVGHQLIEQLLPASAERLILGSDRQEVSGIARQLQRRERPSESFKKRLGLIGDRPARKLHVV